MSRTALAFAVCFVLSMIAATSSRAAVSLVPGPIASCTCTDCSAAHLCVTAPISRVVSAGNSIIISCSGSDKTPAPSAVDNSPGSPLYTLDVDSFFAGDKTRASILSRINIPFALPTTTIITVTMPTTTAGGTSACVVDEYSGITARDVTGKNHQGPLKVQSVSTSSPNLVADAGAVAAFGCFPAGSGKLTALGGYTEAGSKSAADRTVWTEWKPLTTMAVQTAQGDVGANRNCASAIAVYDQFAPPATPTQTSTVTITAMATPTNTIPPPPASDFYVRDFTDGTGADPGDPWTTGHHSWDTSDVWNQITEKPHDPPNASDWVVGQTKAASPGDPNFVFARISRKALPPPGSPDVTVNAQFFQADYGANTNFLPKGSVQHQPFTASDKTKFVDGVPWTLADKGSEHYCLLVEIDAPGDAKAGTLGGSAAQSSEGSIRSDNNKAHRNLFGVLDPVPAPTPPAPGGGGGGGGGGPMAHAMIHNPDVVRQTITVHYEVAPDDLRKMPGSQVAIVGKRPHALAPKGTLTFRDMQPGENRWVALNLGNLAGEPNTMLPVSFFTEIGGQPANGFTIAAVPSSLGDVMQNNLRLHAREFHRLSAGFHVREAEEETGAAVRFLKEAGEREINPSQYMQFVQKHAERLGAIVDQMLRSNDPPDAVKLRAAAKSLAAAAHGDDPRALAIAHQVFLEKLDAQLTMKQKSEGDVADVLQNVRWQKYLYEKLPRLKPGHDVLKRSNAFIDKWKYERAGIQDYAPLMSEVLADLRATATEFADDGKGLARALHAIESALKGAPEGLQKAHRDYLLELQALIDCTSKASQHHFLAE